jgi:hypothetical protein
VVKAAEEALRVADALVKAVTFETPRELKVVPRLESAEPAEA